MPNAILKASGATMTVLDPAYPPARQQVSHTAQWDRPPAKLAKSSITALLGQGH